MVQKRIATIFILLAVIASLINTAFAAAPTTTLYFAASDEIWHHNGDWTYTSIGSGNNYTKPEYTAGGNVWWGITLSNPEIDPFARLNDVPFGEPSPTYKGKYGGNNGTNGIRLHDYYTGAVYTTTKEVTRCDKVDPLIFFNRENTTLTITASDAESLYSGASGLYKIQYKKETEPNNAYQTVWEWDGYYTIAVTNRDLSNGETYTAYGCPDAGPKQQSVPVTIPADDDSQYTIRVTDVAGNIATLTTADIVAMVGADPSSERLPRGYQTLAYIRSTADGGQYIDTDWVQEKPASDHNAFSWVGRFTAMTPNMASTQYYLYGTNDTSLYLYPYLTGGQPNVETIMSYMVSSSYSRGYFLGYNNPTLINRDPIYLAYRNAESGVSFVERSLEASELIADQPTYSHVSGFSSPPHTQTLYLFARNYYSSYSWSMSDGAFNPIPNFELQSFSVWDNDAIAIDMVPAKRSEDGAIGMFDRVTNTFHQSLSDEPFVGGNVVISDMPEIDYAAGGKIKLTCATDHDMYYSVDDGETWTLYTEPFEIGETTVVSAYSQVPRAEFTQAFAQDDGVVRYNEKSIGWFLANTHDGKSKTAMRYVVAPDTDSPTISANLEPNEPTQEDVLVSVSVSDGAGMGVAEVYFKNATDDTYTRIWSGSNTEVETSFTVTQPGTYVVRAVDIVGNRGTITVPVNNIERSAPDFVDSVGDPAGLYAAVVGEEVNLKKVYFSNEQYPGELKKNRTTYNAEPTGIPSPRYGDPKITNGITIVPFIPPEVTSVFYQSPYVSDSEWQSYFESLSDKWIYDDGYCRIPSEITWGRDSDGVWCLAETHGATAGDPVDAEDLPWTSSGFVYGPIAAEDPNLLGTDVPGSGVAGLYYKRLTNSDLAAVSQYIGTEGDAAYSRVDDHGYVQLWEGEPTETISGLYVPILQNGEYVIKAVDAVGNAHVEYIGNYTKIDKTYPRIASAAYKPDSWTNGMGISVTVKDDGTIGYDRSGISKVWRKGPGDEDYILSWETDLSDEYESVSIEVPTPQNGDYYVKILDTAGNETTQYVTMSYVDAVAPEIAFTVSPETWTSDKTTVTVTITDAGGSGVARYSYDLGDEVNHEGVVQPGETTASLTIEVAKNGLYAITAADYAGNETTAQFIVSNIDTEAPVCSVSRNPTGWTAGNVTVSIDATDIGNTIAVPPPWDELVGSTCSGVKEIWYKPAATENFSLLWRATDVSNCPELCSTSFNATTNSAYYVRLVDGAGNSSTSLISIDSIDDSVPGVPNVHVTKLDGTTLPTVEGKSWTNSDVHVQVGS